MKANTLALVEVCNASDAGTVFTGQELSALTGMSEANLCVSDHAGVKDANGAVQVNPSQREQYADILFLRRGRGLYEVLPAESRIAKPATSGRGNRVSPAAALASAQAKLRKSEAENQ